MEIGTTYGSHRVEAKLGEGGMADVYKVWNTGLHRYEALKAPKPHFAHDPTFVTRFLTEARTATSLQHPHIATIHTVSDAQASQPFFTMELVDDGDLADLLRRRGRLELPEVTNLLRQIAAALDHAHSRGIIHRDVKPANVLLQNDGHSGWAVKVVDFGIARAQEAGGGARLTKTGMIVGTPEYMSPEQGGSGAKVDQRTDVYSLGIMAYEMLCGQPPFSVGPEGSAITVILSHIREQPRPPLQNVPGLPLPVNNAILKALAKDPTDRFQTCTEFIDALAGKVAVNLPDPLPVRTEPARLVPGTKPPSRTAPIAIGVVAVFGLALVALGLGHSIGTPHPDTPPVPPGATPVTPSSASSVTPPAPVARKVKVPDVSGMTEKQARGALADKKLRMELTTGESATVAAGRVISQGPDADTSLDPTDTVRVRISTGSPASPVSVQPAVSSAYTHSQPAYIPPRVADISEARAGIAQTISTWKSAWEGLNLSDYMATYSSDARILSNKRWYSYSQYYRNESERFAQGGRIQLSLGTPDITVNGDTAIATFSNTFQRYGGKGNYNSSGAETFKMRQMGGRWLIYEDTFQK